MPAASYADYADILLAMPATANDIARRLGLDDTALRATLRGMLQLGLAHPGMLRIAGRSREAIWIMGEGQQCPDGRRIRPARPKAHLIGFAGLWRELEDGATSRQACAESGASKVTFVRLLRHLRGRQAAHITAWERDAIGRPVAVWRIGSGRDAKKPTKPRREANRQWRQRRRLRDAFAPMREAA